MDRAQKEAFRKHFGAGKLSHIEGQYKDAITHFKRAYELCDSPQLLGWIAREYQAQGKTKLANRYQKMMKAELSNKSPNATVRPIQLEQVIIKPKTPYLLPTAADLPTVEQNVPKSKQAKLTITSNPKGAWVFLYPNLDKPIAVTPSPTMTLQTQKAYRFHIKKAGFKPVDKTVTLKTNTKLHLPLDEQPVEIKPLRLVIPP